MQARRLPAMRGPLWLLAGFRLFRRNPALLTALTLFYLLVVQVLGGLLPGIGPILLPLVLPALTLVVANGCRLVDEGRAPGKAALLAGIAGNGPAMLRLGGLQLLGMLLLLLVNLALNGGSDPFAALEAGAPAGAPAEGAPGPQGSPGSGAPGDPAAEAVALGALMQLMLLAAPLIVAFWFAPFLVGWDRVAPFKAVFFSTVAAWRNWRAMGAFAFAVVAVGGILPGFLLILLGQIPGVSLGAVFIALRLLLAFVVAPILTASVYVSYVDIFRPAVDENA